MVTFDIQGFELEAVEVIGVAIELEMTLVPMCRGEASAGRVLVTLETMGFKLFSINEFGKGKNGSVSYFFQCACNKRAFILQLSSKLHVLSPNY